MPVADLKEVQDHFARARSLQGQGRLAEAAQEWVAGLQVDPRNVSAYSSLADALLGLKLFQPAAIACGEGLLVFPDSAELHDRFGQAMEGAGDRAQAISHFTECLRLRPAHQATAHRLAALLRAEGSLEAARTLLQNLCEVHPRDAGSKFLLAVVLADQGQTEEAMRQLQRALSLQPRFPEALNNLGVLLRAAGRLQESETNLRKAVHFRPEYAAAWNNLGNLYVELSRLNEATRCYDKAISQSPDYAEAHTNRALVSLLKGSFEEGWREYEWRWRQPGCSVRTLSRPEWNGEPLKGKTILIHAEQGAGDTIQFVRYAPMLAAQGASILLHCQESLRSLLAGMPELAGVFSGAVAIADFDFHAPLMSLPRIFGTRLASIPGSVPYISPLPGSKAPPELAACGKFKVGLVWRGNPNHRNDKNRSVPLRLFSDLEVEGAQWFSLQLAPAPAEAECLRLRGIVDLAPYLSDYAATAACLRDLDLLISVDTSVAHLAGALGRPVWTLLPACCDWRWLEDREDTPWYPSMRLVRQQKLGKWRPQIDRIACDLRQEIEKKGKE
jgi:Flp pilus assembly protein TadD